MKRKLPRFNIHSIQSKILFITLAIAVSTTIISLLISYYAEIDTIKSTTESYMTQYISYADHSFNDMMNEVKKISLSISMEREIIYPILLDEAPEASYQKYQQCKKVRSFFAGLMTNNDYIEDILLVTEEKHIFQASQDLIVKRDLENAWMEKMLASENVSLYYNPEEKQVFLCRPISYRDSGRVVNLIKLNYEDLTGVYQSEPLQNVNILIFTPDEQLFFSNADHEGEERQLFEELKAEEEDSGYLRWKGEKYYYIRYYSNDSKMTTLSLIPYKTLLTEANALRQKFFLIGILACMLSFAAAIIFSRRLCQNLQKLTGTMEKVRKGQLEVKADIHSKDEIARLADTFNDMMIQIQGLVTEVKEKERLKLEAEQTVLATQIEPHFLYNSIDSIQYVAHMREEKEIEQVANALSELLRNVLTNKNEMITLWEEREYIENYMVIENFKYRNEYTLLWDVDEPLWDYRLPKLLLQPIVENALIHGLSAKDEGGIINVKIYQSDGEMICKVTDNGKGMSQEEIEQLLGTISRNDKTGFRRVGIANVFGRIKLIYGENYGGTIYGCENSFTCVELHLPGGEEKGETADACKSINCG